MSQKNHHSVTRQPRPTSGIAAAKQINAFFKDGDIKFQVNKYSSLIINSYPKRM